MLKQKYPVYPIGTVQQTNGETTLQIDPEYRAATKGLEDFIHVYILFWASHYEDDAHRGTRVSPCLMLKVSKAEFSAIAPRFVPTQFST